MTLEEREAKLMELVVERRRLGEFDPNAKVIQFMLETLYEMVRKERERRTAYVNPDAKKK